ncbi:MAG: DUF4421 domain-containing protein [Bacteroidales bacterium]|nr:DUF4421 domain-containing protein [Bacteroidales bacterium]
MRRRLFIILSALLCTLAAKAISFDLDSIAAMGRFPRFCVNTYYWGDKFFNGYDTTYVDGTGYKWNAKLRTESWTDYYGLNFKNGTRMSMISDPSTSVGLYLTYMALSVGYDMNLSKYFNGHDEARKRWNFGFNCMLFSVNLYFIRNDVGTTITSLKPYDKSRYNPDVEYKGLNNTTWGIDFEYYFTHRSYSHAAAFNFSRIQKRSAGSFFGGFTYDRIKYDFNLNSLPPDIFATVPDDIPDNHYIVNTDNYILSGGYGYNWVFARHWLLGSSLALMSGISDGYYVDVNQKKVTGVIMGKANLSVVWNNNHWFAGAVCTGRLGMVRDHRRSTLSSVGDVQVSAGYRFNLW